jgi:hypothetical protein
MEIMAAAPIGPQESSEPSLNERQDHALKMGQEGKRQQGAFRCELYCEGVDGERACCLTSIYISTYPMFSRILGRRRARRSYISIRT